MTTKITSAGWVFVMAGVTLIVVVVTAVVLVVLMVVTLDQTRMNKREADENELHIDCVVAYREDLYPPACLPINAELVAAGFLPPPEEP